MRYTKCYSYLAQRERSEKRGEKQRKNLAAKKGCCWNFSCTIVLFLLFPLFCVCLFLVYILVQSTTENNKEKQRIKTRIQVLLYKIRAPWKRWLKTFYLAQKHKKNTAKTVIIKCTVLHRQSSCFLVRMNEWTWTEKTRKRPVYKIIIEGI